jgi:hypothetical protein
MPRRQWPLFALLFACLIGQSSVDTAAPFDGLFTGDTMRVDVFHSGGPAGESVALERVVNDGPWSGSRTRLVDDTNLGTYLVEVIEPSTNQVIYSRGYASIFAEWLTTADAKATAGTFHESLRFPWPRRAVQVVLKKRDTKNTFREVWSTVIDPASRAVNPARAAAPGKVWTVFENGPAATKVDLLLLGEGYTDAELPKFHADVKRLVEVMFSVEPYKSRRSDFNVRAIDLPTAQSGANNPRTADHRRTPLGVTYNLFDSERYAMSVDNRGWRDVAASAPYDAVEILINNRYYGGGGIFNDHAAVAVDTGSAEYIFVHEFGHHFAALADEYYTSEVAYETGGEKIEPWEPNVTALHDPANLKWKDLVAAGTPLPTPWEKAPYEAKSREVQAERRRLRAAGAPEAEMDKLFATQKAWETTFLASQAHAKRVGAFEGAAYEPKGLYRPETDCIMFSRDDVGFCRVCRRAIERVIDMYTR